MTTRQHNRLRRWQRRTAKAYSAGLIEGQDCFREGRARPEDPDEGYDAPFDINVYLFTAQRIDQYYRNNELARRRGALDGYDEAQEQLDRAQDMVNHAQEVADEADFEEWIADTVTVGMKDLVDYMRINDRTGESWAA